MLKAGELCPIHKKRTNCCGRSEQPERYGRVRPAIKYRMVAPGVREYSDGSQRRSRSALEEIKKWKLKSGETCAACGQEFDDFREVELAHIESKGLGGGKHNDHPHNLVLMHKSANRAQGSKPLDVYLAERGGKDCPQ